jgi:hypothetical protein
MVGDVVKMGRVGYPEIDNKVYVIGTIDDTANTFEVLGSDTTGSTGALEPSPTVSVVKVADFAKLCLSNIAPNAATPGTFSVGTFCDPTASLPNPVTEAGTITLDGYVDVQDPGYAELLKAEEDGGERYLEVVLPRDLGYIVVPITISSVTWTLPLEGAIGFSAAGAMGSKPRHLY